MKYTKTFLVFMILLGLGACGTEGQIVGMYEVGFASTLQCDESLKTLKFNNNTGEEIKIKGVAITVGTNPADETTKKRNFGVEGTVIGGAGLTNQVDDVLVPAGSDYAVVVAYTPQTQGSHTALVDIAYEAPKQGVVQLSLSGTSEGQGTCVVAEEVVSVDFDGDLFFKITYMAAAVSGAPVRLSSQDAVSPFQPPTVPFLLKAADKEAILPKIDASANFSLPPSGLTISTIPNPTKVTVIEDVQGTYDPEIGEVILKGMKVHLESAPQFIADIAPFDLTTGSVDFPVIEGLEFVVGNVEVDKILNLIDGKPTGVSIRKNGRVVLVGASRLTNFGGDEEITSILEAQKGAIVLQIEGFICNTEEECASK
ncbi:MAG: hypothetical protein A3F89_02900 [Deltaproteobacteria bacterium RIFCSPLOWO2_12_FULL_50_11]|nr:MAG: hypothetical protein A3F89_02900 [Deltaproteobacteria bacterium RIFCSPLOWO2_12_FULL_50_11]